jgi:hypothetical protein
MKITIFTLIRMIRLIGFNIQDKQIHVNITYLFKRQLLSFSENELFINSLPFMTFWCKIMTKTKFEL